MPNATQDKQSETDKDEEKIASPLSQNADSLQIQPQNIPQELKDLRQWVCFEVKIEKSGKLGKLPKNPHTGKNANSNNSETWGTFNDAIAGCHKYNFSNIGFAFSEHDPFCGIDIDQCVSKEGLSEIAKKVLSDFIGTYSEYSTSGTGIHIITKGTIPKDGRKNTKLGIEIYRNSRFFVWTGNIIGDTPQPVINQQEQLDTFYSKYFKKEEPQRQAPSAASLSMSDNEIIEKAKSAKNGHKFSRLYAGDLSDYHNNHSDADQALCCLIAFWTQAPDQIGRIFCSSSLYRKKWDRKDYREKTISNAIAGCTEVYQPRHMNNKDEKKSEENRNKKSKQIFTPFSFDELLAMPSKEWLLDQIFGEGDIGMLYGPPGVGKTFVTIDIILQGCLGGIFANQFKFNRPLNFVYCAGEGLSGLRSRFLAAAVHYEISTLQNFTFYKTVPQFFDYKAENGIENFIHDWRDRQMKGDTEPLDVVVIDTLHCSTIGADENSAQDMGKVLQACRRLNDALGCTIILVHHTNKTGSSERGSSALRGAMNFMIKIEKGERGHAVMSCDKLKDGKNGMTKILA